jgi:hypothetical protein
MTLNFDPHNCIVYAIAMWWRYGGRILFRQSPHGWWFHCWWTLDDKTLYEYTPRNPVKGMWFPPPIYNGYVKVTTP